MVKSLVLKALLLAASVRAQFPGPESCSGTCVNTHDPTIIRRDDGTYFRFSTGGRVAVHTAPSLEGPWKYEGAALPDGSSIPLEGNQDLWAPDIFEHDGTYYIYYSVSRFGVQDSAIGVASSPTMDIGTWTDHGSTGVQSTEGDRFNAIDANLINVNGQLYMSFGSFWEDLFLWPMENPLTIAPGSSPQQIAFDPPTTALEAPYIFQHDKFFYLFFSKGKCCGYDAEMPAPGEEYQIKVCRSATIDGEYVDSKGASCNQGGGDVVLKSHGSVYGAGHQGVYNDPTHGPVLYYHYVDTNIGFRDGEKQFGWNYLDFSSGWPVLSQNRSSTSPARF
ncbi:putative arabinan endo-1,5-alpha-L-arabinosidase A [Paramyrothecium foliicola]|nr:putative arabinan endo-1,5-alpha-L-arabinosidase A [Paramyrothecium foliicola]